VCELPRSPLEPLPFLSISVRSKPGLASLAFPGSVLLGSCSRLFGGETMVDDKELTRFVADGRSHSFGTQWRD
jgi:hypothetical protein